MATRSTRNQPFCWQEKKILRLLRKNYHKSELAKFRNLYLALTEIDSDFNGQPIRFYTKTISTYSGLSREWIPSGLKVLEGLNVLRIERTKSGGKFEESNLIFTPENVKKLPIKTVVGKTANGSTDNGDTTHKEDSSYLEDSNLEEEGYFTNEKPF